MLRIINLPIKLEIYLDNKNEGKGLLYLDDGESFDYKSEERTLIEFSYSKDVLISRALLRDSFYEMAAEMII